MAAHRYWRALALETYGGDLELGTFHLHLAGARVDAPATLTSSSAPAAGALANLQDTNAATTARWSTIAGLSLTWDFGGSPADVDDIRLNGPEQARFLSTCGIQYSDDASTWVTAFVVAGAAWPGAGVDTASVQMSVWDRLYSAQFSYLDQDRTRLTNLGSTAVVGAQSFTPRSSGVLQVEFLVDGDTAEANLGVTLSSVSTLTAVLGASAGTWAWASFGGSTSQMRSEGATTTYSTAYPLGTVVGMVVDFTTGNLTFYKNGVSQGVAATGFAGKELVPATSNAQSSSLKKTVKLRTANFAYPIAGATPWDSRVRIRQDAGVARLSEQSVVYGAQPPAVYGTGILHTQLVSRYNYLTGGTGRVRGTVKEKNTPTNTPLSRRVRLIRDRDGMLVREQWSDATTGAYDFQDVELNEAYTVLSYDHLHNYRAVVADNLTPEVMP